MMLYYYFMLLWRVLHFDVWYVPLYYYSMLLSNLHAHDSLIFCYLPARDLPR